MILRTAFGFYLIFSATVSLAASRTTSGHDQFEGADQVLRFSFEPEEDRDHDRHPDDWTRRIGPGFPLYVDTRIDRNWSRSGRQSLRFDVNGGKAILYSDPKRIDSRHALVLRGYIRTQQLQHDAALISVSLLDHKRRRVQRYLSRPVTGTHADWVRVRIGPIDPHPSVRFAVVGCHLVHGEKKDIRGTVWFDDLWIGRLPQLQLLNDFNVHFRQPNNPLLVSAAVSGLERDRDYELHFKLMDGDRNVLAEHVRALRAGSRPPEDEAGHAPEQWSAEPQPHGFYWISATLVRDAEVVLTQETSLVVMDFDDHREQGGFGWTVSHPIESQLLGDLAETVSQAGVNWLKYPLWPAAADGKTGNAVAVQEFVDAVSRRGVTPVGLLNHPPAEVRAKFAANWRGVGELFGMPPAIWSASTDRVMARFAGSVRYWQLGGESDGSFVGMQRLNEALSRVKSSFDRIGRDTVVGVPWDWKSPLPSRAELPRSFVSLANRGPSADPAHATVRLSDQEFTARLDAGATTSVPRWVLLRPLPRSEFTQLERGADLVRQMVAAKIGRADAIFADDVFHPDRGLLNADGSPTPLFLPWRSTAAALRGAEYLGSLDLLGGSTNHVFAHGGEAIMFVWNESPVTEELYLGERPTATDVSGRKYALSHVTGPPRQRIAVGPSPLIIRGCSEAVARWRMSVALAELRLRSETGEQSNLLRGRNTFPQGVSGRVTLNLPPEWRADVNHWPLTLAADEAYDLPLFLTLPAYTSLGRADITIDFDIAADRRYQFRVHRAVHVGMGDVMLDVRDTRDEDGRLRVEQIITNHTSPSEVLSFRCSLFIPGQKRQKKLVVKLAQGEDRQYYFVPNADELHGRELWLRAEQIDGPRVLNFKWTAGRTDTETSSPPGK